MDKYDVLTESMFYVLMAFSDGQKSGVEIVEFVKTKTHQRVPLAPGTLYTILGKFEKDNLITEVHVEGRKRTYKITKKGLRIYNNEQVRLQQLLTDAKETTYEKD